MRQFLKVALWLFISYWITNLLVVSVMGPVGSYDVETLGYVIFIIWIVIAMIPWFLPEKKSKNKKKEPINPYDCY